MEIFHTIIYQPLYNILIILYNFIPGQDFGIAIIFFTILLRALLVPFYKKQIESQKRLQEIQPQIKEIQQKHKDNKEKQTKELMSFYKQNKTNPFSGCLPLIIQLVFLIAIYRILINISNEKFIIGGNELYSFVSNPGAIKHSFLGLVNLANPSIALAVLAAVAQFFQTKMLMKKQPKKGKEDSGQPDFGQIMNKQMMYLGPLLTLFIGVKFPAGLALYWLVSTLFMIGQQLRMDREIKK
jgi:YidC/Oxa1 family membrane protein insertase